VLPFILRRTKDSALPDLPPKVITDIRCPMTASQRILYASFQKGLSISDEALEQEIVSLIQNQAGGGLRNKQKSHTQARDTDHLPPALPIICHPFKALANLKLICVHPNLLERYRGGGDDNSGDESNDYSTWNIYDSGKLTCLVRLLLDMDLVECSPLVLSGEIEPMLKRMNEDTGGDEIMQGTRGNIKEVAIPWDNHPDSDSDSPSSGDDQNSDEEGQGEDKKEIKSCGLGDFLAKKKSGMGNESEEGEEEEEKEKADASLAHIPIALGRVAPGSSEVKHESIEHRTSLQVKSSVKKKCLIFAEHRSSLDLIHSAVFQRYFPKTSVRILDGRTPPQKRAQIAQDFNQGVIDEDSPTILLLTASACGLGLNLSSAEVVIFLEHNWNPFVDLQAMDRVHRLGQKNTVYVFKLLGSFIQALHYIERWSNL
jgi:SNF2 family DNA or RNA helicase